MAAGIFRNRLTRSLSVSATRRVARTIVSRREGSLLFSCRRARYPQVAFANKDCTTAPRQSGKPRQPGPSAVHPSLLRSREQNNSELNLFPLRAIHSSDCFPTSAAGDRNRDSGALENVGVGGFAWSSSPYASGHPNASFLGFKQSYVEPFRTDNRSYALSVRCVQHLHELFF